MSNVDDMKKNSEKIKSFFAELDCRKTTKFQKTMKLADHTELDAALYKWFVQKRENFNF